jgi:hypothetical protein
MYQQLPENKMAAEITISRHLYLIFLDKNMYTEKHLIELFNDHDYR